MADLPELLEIATSAKTPEIVQLAERFLQSPEAVRHVEETIREHLGSLGVVYSGDLVDGEAYDAELAGEPKMDDFSVLSASPTTVSLLLTIRVPLRVRIQYNDLSRATYDHEDHRYYNVEIVDTEIEDESVIRLFISIERSSGNVEDIEVITQDVYVSEPYEDYR